jgi:hypothetical protein
MKIVEVSYRALRTGTGYNNTSAEARAIVDDGETPEDAMLAIKQWVDGQISENMKRDSLHQTIAQLSEQAGNWEKECARLKKRTDGYLDLLREKRKLAELARANGLGGDALLLDQI